MTFNEVRRMSLRNRHGILPRLLRRERAAAYLDISPGSFDRLVREEKLPAPKFMEGFKVWDRAELDDYADRLPGGGCPADGRSDLDKLLGVS